MDKPEVTIKDVYILIKEVNVNLSQRIERIEEVTNNLSTAIYAEVETVKTKVHYLEEENKELKNLLSKIEKKTVANNLIFYGILEDPEDLPENLEEKIRELVVNKLKVSLEKTEINNIFRLGKRSNHTRPILLSLTTYLKKREILKNCSKLKGSKIFVSEELLKEELKERKILLEGLKEARNNSQKANIKGNKLIVEDKIYSVAEVKNTLRNPKDDFSNISTRETSSEPPTPSPKKYEIEEEIIIPTQPSQVETKLAEGSKYRNEERVGREKQKVQSYKTHQVSTNDTPKKSMAITRTLRTQKKQ